MFANESAWVDRFWHGERVSVQLEDRETRVASTFTLSLSVPISLPFSPFSTHPFLSRILFLSHPARLLSGAPRRAVSASSASASSRRSSLSFSLVFLSALSVVSAASRRYDALRRLSHLGRDAAVNFPTIYISDTDLTVDNRNRRYKKTSIFFHTSPLRKCFRSICMKEEKVLIVTCKR